MRSKLRSLRDLALQLPGIRLKDKVIVFESDDWGSKRMPNVETYNYCLQNGYKVDQNVYTHFDCLETEEDVHALSEVLFSRKSKPVFTLNTIVANPDYQEIKRSNFKEYHFQTIDKDSIYQKALNSIKKGIDGGVFSAQFHGREHINVKRWLQALQQQDEDICFAFDLEMAGIFPKENVSNGNDMVVAFEHVDQIDLENMSIIADEGLSIFKSIFGKKSETAISCNYVWSDEIEEAYHNSGVKLIQGSRVQLIPTGGYKGFQRRRLYTGKRNMFGQVYTVRNVQFEPSYNQEKNWVEAALNQIELSFKCKKPAIISTHRMNYCGGLSKQNRDASLSKLKILLDRIEQKWPEADFCSSDQLYSKYLKK